jgi:hypothetical protein
VAAIEDREAHAHSLPVAASRAASACRTAEWLARWRRTPQRHRGLSIRK